MSNETKAVDVLAVIDGLQFGFNHRRCPRCAGWNMSENGETDNAHTVACDVPKARAAIAELIEADKAYDVAWAALNTLVLWQAAVIRREAALAAAQGPQA